jgi:dolichol kinase
MKKTIYIILAAFLGLILSFIAHAVIEIVYLSWAEEHARTVKWVTVWGGNCALPLWLIYLLPILGIIFGIILGFFWWKKVYGKS